MVWRGAGLAVAAVAIWLAGFDVYKKGLTALRHGRLNINALMTVAVTGAFAIGQWPEAAMVMALYAIAEAIEAQGRGPRAQRHQGPAGDGAGGGVGSPGRRQLGDAARGPWSRLALCCG
jgi:cation transport ATPase